MQIVCAESVLEGPAWLSPLGKVTVLPDSEIGADAVSDADALIIRSKTRVTRDLVQGSRLRFVATATAGIDHIDIQALEEAGITWYAAHGSNAASVGEYILFALLCAARKHQLSLKGKTLGIIGCGHCGSAVMRLADALGMNLLLNDPPRKDRGDVMPFVDLERLLAEADFVTLHVPLTEGGVYPTRQLAGHAFFEAMKPGAVFINASRGEVAVEQALADALSRDHLAGAVLDVFEGEPNINASLVSKLLLATPHIAGYSWDGRLRGTAMAAAALADWLGTPPPAVQVHSEPIQTATLHDAAADGQVFEAVSKACGLLDDDAALRQAAENGLASDGFLGIRKHYRKRREFPAWQVAGPLHPDAAAVLKNLGFTIP